MFLQYTHFFKSQILNVENDNSFGLGADLYHASVEIKVRNKASLSCCVDGDRFIPCFRIFFFFCLQKKW